MRVLSNLMNNSFEATNGKGTVFVKISISQNFFKVIVNDDGSGLEDEQMSQITQMGFSGKVNSKGLGLYHAKKVIEDHSGKILIYNTHPGLCVEVILPIV